MVDPWGNPYEYLNIAALTLGVGGNGGGNGGGGGGGGNGAAGGGGGGGKQHFPLVRADSAYAAGAGNGSAGRPRKDRFLHPINSDYDLYSMGKDGESVEPLTAQKSHDDVIRANDGSFVGWLSSFSETRPRADRTVVSQ
jgi:general secretion pathway protein G